MTIKQRIISFLQNNLAGIDDDDLARALNLKSRQQANSRCRALEIEGLVVRRRVDGKIHNYWTGHDIVVPPDARPVSDNYRTILPKHEYWFWEGNVQATVINALVEQGYLIHFSADTASHQRGIDIVAEVNGKPLWVSVKGYPRGTDKTKPSLQASHWFKKAIFDMIEYRERDKNVALAVAFPDFPRYHYFAQKITWLKPVANFVYFWVNEDGEVIVE